MSNPQVTMIILGKDGTILSITFHEEYIQIAGLTIYMGTTVPLKFSLSTYIPLFRGRPRNFSYYVIGEFGCAVRLKR